MLKSYTKVLCTGLQLFKRHGLKMRRVLEQKQVCLYLGDAPTWWLSFWSFFKTKHQRFPNENTPCVQTVPLPQLDGCGLAALEHPLVDHFESRFSRCCFSTALLVSKSKAERNG